MDKLFFSLLLFSSFVFSQNTIRIEYGVQFEGEFLTDEFKKNAELASTMDGIEGSMSKYKFELFYNKDQSLYKAIPQMATEDEATSETIAKIFIDYEKIFFRDTKNKELLQNCDLDGNRYNVTAKYNSIDWKLSTETKKISNFNCYKATGKIRNVEVTAWYCPQIPYNVGPNVYGNLPGLILELSQGKLRYLATSVNLNFKDKIAVEKPKGKTITSEEFDALVERQRSNFENSH